MLRPRVSMCMEVLAILRPRLGNVMANRPHWSPALAFAWLGAAGLPPLLPKPCIPWDHSKPNVGRSAVKRMH